MSLTATFPAYTLTRMDGGAFDSSPRHGNLRDVAWLAVLPGYRRTLHITPQADGTWIASLSERRRIGGTRAVGYPVRITPLGDVPAPQLGQVWRHPHGHRILLYPCPHPDRVYMGALNLDTGRREHVARQIEMLDCGYTRVHALPCPAGAGTGEKA